MGARLGGHDDDDLAVNHEINVTPFIDVILVLLIIFMVAAPLATVDVPVDLPASTAAQQPRPDKPVYLTVKDDLSLVLGDQPISTSGLVQALEGATHGDKETRIFLRADRVVPYGDLMDTMNKLRDAGYLKVALVGIEQAVRP
ncbi:TonB system transport protein ExbD [Lacibacterium aquatile]|uniref:Biopolymer transport protein ExbD n=1 Tax=Lacibacterium aquatile TaxID=1168082 RepID=A0ABW5DVJ1_9PROT